MRVSSYAVARPAYYDRGASSVITVYSATATPHGATTRATYTVAAGYKALVEVSAATTQTVTAPAVAGRTVAFVQLSNGSVSGTLARIDQTAATVAATYVLRQGQGSPTLYAGEYTEILTLDLSTGGSIAYEVFAKMTLFQA